MDLMAAIEKNISKYGGDEYNGYLIPFRLMDAIAVYHAKNAFELGETFTYLEFTNGVVMPINSTDFVDFVKWFAVKRNSYFIGE